MRKQAIMHNELHDILLRELGNDSLSIPGEGVNLKTADLPSTQLAC